VVGRNFFSAYDEILTQGVPAWVDPLQNYRSRGYPVSNTGLVPTSFHMGGFLGVPDVDGETQLAHEHLFKKAPPVYLSKPVLVGRGQYIPVNGGICGWRSELTPFIHYTLWHEELAYRRYDDIWMGIILKTWMDLCDFNMSYGPPLVNHLRASDPHKNIGYEKTGKEWNESFWQKLRNNIFTNSTDRSIHDNFELVANALRRIENPWARREADAMIKWHSLLTA
jgi:hypothetical protein